MASRLGISRRSKHIELKYLWIQDEVKEGKLELKKVGTHFHPSDVLTKDVPASIFGQHLPHLISSRSAQLSSKTSSVFISTSVNLHIDINAGDVVNLHVLLHAAAAMMLKKSFVLGSDKLQGASEEFSHLLVKGAEIKDIFKESQLFIVVIMTFIMIQKFKRVSERE